MPGNLQTDQRGSEGEWARLQPGACPQWKQLGFWASFLLQSRRPAQNVTLEMLPQWKLCSVWLLLVCRKALFVVILEAVSLSNKQTCLTSRQTVLQAEDRPWLQLSELAPKAPGTGSFC